MRCEEDGEIRLVENMGRIEMVFVQSCFWSFGRQFQSQRATVVVSLSLDGGGPAALPVEQTAAPASVPGGFTVDTDGFFIEFVRAPPSPLRQLVNRGCVLLVVLEAKVVEVHLLELRERRRRAVPALGQLTCCTDAGGDDWAVCDPVCNFLHTVQAGTGLSALVGVSAWAGRTAR